MGKECFLSRKPELHLRALDISALLAPWLGVVCIWFHSSLCKLKSQHVSPLKGRYRKIRLKHGSLPELLCFLDSESRKPRDRVLFTILSRLCMCIERVYHCCLFVLGPLEPPGAFLVSLQPQAVLSRIMSQNEVLVPPVPSRGLLGSF